MSDPTAIELGGIGASTDPRVRRMKGIAVHGYTPFDVPFITEVADNLWHGGVEPGLNLPDFVRHIVSLYPWAAYPVKNHNKVLSSVTVRMLDDVGQDLAGIDVLAAWVNICRRTGPVLVHCQAGLNRSSLVVGRALVLSGEVADGAEAIEKMRAARSPAVLCNPAFERWIREGAADAAGQELAA